MNPKLLYIYKVPGIASNSVRDKIQWACKHDETNQLGAPTFVFISVSSGMF